MGSNGVNQIAIEYGATPDFTVLMAVYGGDDPRLFGDALTSLFGNTMQPKTVIIVVDGPVTSELAGVLSDFEIKYTQLKIIKLKQNQGLTLALNQGLANVMTEWVARADADDINLPDRFERMFAKISELNGSVDIIGSAIDEVDTDGTKITARVLPASHDQIVNFAIRRNPFNHMTTVFRTELAKRVGGYPDLYGREDYGLWAKMISAGARCNNLTESTVRATTGTKFFERRGGFRYACGEYQLQKLLVECGQKKIKQAIIDGGLRGLVFALPVGIRRIIYEKILRC